MHLRFFVAVLALSSVASAQNVFLAIEDGGSPKMVKQVALGRPQIEIDGKLHGVSTPTFALARATIYRPGLVTISDFRVQSHHIESLSTGGSFNYELRIYGHIKSDVALKSCFIVLELNSWKDRGCLSFELRDLGPGKSEDLNLNFNLSDHLEEGTFRLHFFSEGLEVLTSKMPARYISTQQQKTQAFLSGTSQDFPAVPAHPAPAAYPAELKADKMPGSARVKCHVATNGDVTKVELVSATHPAFGAAALAAAPKWKFDPAIKDRHFVESDTVIPFEFKPPH